MGCAFHFIPIRRRRNLAHSMLRLSNFDLFSLSTFLQNRAARNVFDCIRWLTIQRREIGITPHYTRELKKLAAMSNSKAAAKNAIKRGWKGWRNETRTARRKTGRLLAQTHRLASRSYISYDFRFDMVCGVLCMFGLVESLGREKMKYPNHIHTVPAHSLSSHPVLGHRRRTAATLDTPLRSTDKLRSPLTRVIGINLFNATALCNYRLSMAITHHIISHVG